MLKIGLTGGIGSGKTFVCNVFKELGVSVYNADIEAKRLMETDPEIIRMVKSLLGPDSYEKGSLNRNYISEIVFADKKKLTALNAIVHPAVRQDFNEWTLGKSNEPYVIEEAALLFESGGAAMVDYTIFVKADLHERIDRVVERDHVSPEKVRARMDNQMDDDEKEKLSDFVIINKSGSMILPQIVALHNNFIEFNN